jgi:uncharacterized protein (TIGR02757 family)
MAKNSMNLTAAELRSFLLEKADQYETRAFIPDDPVDVPHRFSDAGDQAMAGLFTALIAWGNRKAILKSADELMRRMDGAPADFVAGATAGEVERAFAGFVHRTFMAVDAGEVVLGVQRAVAEAGSLEAAFGQGQTAFDRLAAFHDLVFAGRPADLRSRKHVADPRKGSAAKRLNMFLRWMVRPAARGVDLGLWPGLGTAGLMMPLDVHTSNIGRRLGLLTRKANDWKAVEELTASLRAIDPEDPVRLDFALFGLGAIEGF